MTLRGRSRVGAKLRRRFGSQRLGWCADAVDLPPRSTRAQPVRSPRLPARVRNRVVSLHGSPPSRPDVRITVVGVGVDRRRRRNSPDSQERTSSSAWVMDYQPNVEGVLWFVNEVWPLIRAALPGLRFTIVGARPLPRVQRLESNDGVRVTGSVDDVRPFLWRAAVSVAPLLTGRGTQTKVLEALAAGLPVVTTPLVGSGLPVEALAGCSLANNSAAFADAVIRLLRSSRADRRRISESVRLDTLSWNVRLAESPSIMVAGCATLPCLAGAKTRQEEQQRSLRPIFVLGGT